MALHFGTRLARLAAGEPARRARRGAGDVARDARRGGRPDRLAPGRADHLARRACSPPTSPRSPPGSRRRRWAQVELADRRRSVALAAVYVAARRGRRRVRWRWAATAARPATAPGGSRLAAGGGGRWSRSAWRRSRPAARLGRRRAAASRSLTRRRPRRRPGRRDPARARRGASRCSSTPVRPTPAWPTQLGRARDRSARGARRSPIPTSTTSAAHRSCSPRVAVDDLVFARRDRADSLGSARAARTPGSSGSARARRCGRAACGSRCSGRRPAWRASRRRRGGAERARARPPRPLARLSDPAHGRRRGRARPGRSRRRRRAQGRPPRQRRRRPRRRCSPRPIPSSR